VLDFVAQNDKILKMRQKFFFDLTIILFLFFLLLLGYSKLALKVGPTDLVSYSLASLGSSVGVSVSVPPNPYNTLAVQLEQWQKRLEEKEKVLTQKEIELNQRTIFQGEIISKLVVALLIIIFLLILINFYLDFKFRIRFLKKNQERTLS
jgi:hypothetical protein